MLSIKRVRASIANRSKERKLLHTPSLPLTERNIKFLNDKAKDQPESEREEDEDYYDSEDERRKNACDRLFCSREVQISEWLRMLP